jgi:hypothetical protein
MHVNSALLNYEVKHVLSLSDGMTHHLFLNQQYSDDQLQLYRHLRPLPIAQMDPLKVAP